MFKHLQTFIYDPTSLFLSDKRHTLLIYDNTMSLYPQRNCPSISKFTDADACANADADQCSYILQESSFCYSADVHTYADRSILAITLLWQLELFISTYNFCLAVEDTLVMQIVLHFLIFLQYLEKRYHSKILKLLGSITMVLKMVSIFLNVFCTIICSIACHRIA